LDPKITSNQIAISTAASSAPRVFDRRRRRTAPDAVGVQGLSRPRNAAFARGAWCMVMRAIDLLAHSPDVSEHEIRAQLEGNACTSFLIVDAQSVKNTDTAALKGYDTGKKVFGIKRHIAVDANRRC
jgi:hypothetical protein